MAGQRADNTEVPHVCGISGNKAFLLAAQLCWVGHVVRMEDNWIPKQVFFGQLLSCKCPQCGPVRRYKDTVKTNMKRCSLRPKSLSTAPFDRAQWCTTCQSATASYEESRVAELDRKWAARKQQAINTTGTVWPCDRCNRTCSSRIGLFIHRHIHRWCNPSYSTVHSIMCVCVGVCVSQSLTRSLYLWPYALFASQTLAFRRQFARSQA